MFPAFLYFGCSRLLPWTVHELPHQMNLWLCSFPRTRIGHTRNRVVLCTARRIGGTVCQKVQERYVDLALPWACSDRFPGSIPSITPPVMVCKGWFFGGCLTCTPPVSSVSGTDSTVTVSVCVSLSLEGASTAQHCMRGGWMVVCLPLCSCVRGYARVCGGAGGASAWICG